MKYEFIILMICLFINSHIKAQTILCLGDSLTEGYQIPVEDAYPAILENKMKTKFPQIKVINAGISGSTSASGVKRLKWYLRSKPQVLILALGANDGLRGLSPMMTQKNLEEIIKLATSSGIKVILAGMKMPPNMGKTYQNDFEKIFSTLAKNYQLTFVPFLLEGVAGKEKFNLADGIHPNSRGHEIMANLLLKPLLGVLL
jgi:acyl-CoA thioesterase I